METLHWPIDSDFQEALRQHVVTRPAVPRLSLSPDPPPPPMKPKLTATERRAREADRLKTIRLRVTIGQELEERGITTPAAIGAALGLPAAEATKLLARHQWREGDVALLETATARLGLVGRQAAPPGSPSRRCR